MERHRENSRINQTKPTSVPRFLSFITARAHIQRPPVLLLRASRPPCRKLHVSGSPPIPFPFCLALISLLDQEEQRRPLPESTEVEETESLTRQRERKHWRERTRQEQIVRGSACQVYPGLEWGNELFKSSGSQMVLLQNQVLYWTSSRDLQLLLGGISK